MASQDTGLRKRRAISQDNNARIEKLHKEFRKLNAGTKLNGLTRSALKRSEGNTGKPKS
jgi:hypothetical protein